MVVQGVYAAVLAPRLPDGALDTIGFRAILEFLRGRGLTRIVVNGATGEYCLTTAPELAAMPAICREALPGAEVLCSIGAAGLAGCLELGHCDRSRLPVPWGLKLIAECRGITAAWFSQPLSAARTAQASEFRAWFPRLVGAVGERRGGLPH